MTRRIKGGENAEENTARASANMGYASGERPCGCAGGGCGGGAHALRARGSASLHFDGRRHTYGDKRRFPLCDTNGGNPACADWRDCLPVRDDTRLYDLRVYRPDEYDEYDDGVLSVPATRI